MAPENAPSLVILDTRIENGDLRGSCEYIEPRTPGTRLRVRWAVESQPQDFAPVGGGVAYIYSKGAEFESLPVVQDAIPTALGQDRYRWTEGLNAGIPWVMFILILPGGYTLSHASPEPAGTRVFRDRLALYWVLRGDDLNRTQVSWTLTALRTDVRTEQIHINRLLSREAPTQTASLAIEDVHKVPTSAASTAAAPAAQESKPELFISYAWGGQSEEIVNLVDQAFQNHGVSIIRDKRDLGYRGLIKEFMQRIGRGKAVIVVVSDKYLKSENCMYELAEIAAKGDVYDRIFPIVLPDAQIYKPVKRVRYIKYWEEQISELDDALKKVSAANLQGLRDDIDNYTRIRNTIAALTDTLRNMNTLTPEVHERSGFAELLSAVERKLGL
jgi:hypothetical protein